MRTPNGYIRADLNSRTYMLIKNATLTKIYECKLYLLKNNKQFLVSDLMFDNFLNLKRKHYNTNQRSCSISYLVNDPKNYQVYSISIAAGRSSHLGLHQFVKI